MLNKSNAVGEWNGDEFSDEIGKAVGRSRRTIDSYISELRAVTQMELDVKIFRMHRLGIPQDRIAERLGIPQRTLSDHLAEMAELPNPLNADLSRGFPVVQVAEKHGWPEPMVWSIALEGTVGDVHWIIGSLTISCMMFRYYAT